MKANPKPCPGHPPTHCWGETYSYDAWGNLLAIGQTADPNYTGCTQESGFSPPTVTTKNQFSTFGYDASGNTTGDTVYSYTWNGESQLKSANGVNYLYDGDGRRASKSNGKLYWYGSGGEILAETNASGATTNEYIFFGGKRVALIPAGSTAQFYAEDFLGSSRIVTTNTGVLCYDADFYPYGGERSYTNSCTQNAYKFEGKERDSETLNDEFGARYYTWRFGRWLSSDWSSVPVPVPYANLTNPQTLNLYAMVADDPESFADLDGHCWNGFGWICNTGQAFNNLFHGLGFHTDRRVAEIVGQDSQSLRKRGVSVEGLTDKQIIKTFKVTTAMAAARPTPAQARALWEKATGGKVPFDEKYNRFYDMAHKQAIVDGGDPLDPNNLKPQQHDEHMQEHMENGDFKRWGARAKQLSPEQIKQLEMEAETEAEMERQLNHTPADSGGPPPD